MQTEFRGGEKVRDPKCSTQRYDNLKPASVFRFEYIAKLPHLEVNPPGMRFPGVNLDGT